MAKSKIIILVICSMLLTHAFADDSRFIKLDFTCKELAKTSTQFEVVYDSSNELYWEVKTDDGSVRSFDKKFHWGGDSIPDYKGVPKQLGNWNSLVEYVNTRRLCGFDDWRVPTIKELASLSTGSFKGDGKYWPTKANWIGKVYLNPLYFPNILKTTIPFFWSTEFYSEGAYGFGFNVGNSGGVMLYEDEPASVMLVRKKT